MEASVIGLGIAVIAVAVALVATVVLARQRPRAVRASRARHPASTPPVAISLVRDGRDAHWRLDVRSGAPPVSVDIVSYRAAGGGEWEAAPIVDPVELGPGGWAVLPHAVVGRAPEYDVVLGWTEHRADGDRTGSGSFRVHEAGPLVPVVPVVPGRHAGWVVAAIGVALLLLGAGALVVAQLGDELATAPPPDTTAPDTTGSARTETATTTPTAAVTSSPGATAPTSPPPTTIDATTPAATTGVTTTGVTTSSTVATTSVTTTSTAVTAPDGPSVQAQGRIDACRFGPDCLVVGFTIDGFEAVEPSPTEYVCEFADGERVAFRFVGDGADTACSARSADPSITVEVAGVRSNTVRLDDLGPVG